MATITPIRKMKLTTPQSNVLALLAQGYRLTRSRSRYSKSWRFAEGRYVLDRTVDYLEAAGLLSTVKRQFHWIATITNDGRKAIAPKKDRRVRKEKTARGHEEAE
jgi:hypothetical protein